MKNSEIASIILIASISILVAYFTANSLFGSATDQTATVPVVERMTSDITPPDPTIFSPDAINPTVEIEIGEDISSADEDQSVTADENKQDQP